MFIEVCTWAMDDKSTSRNSVFELVMVRQVDGNNCPNTEKGTQMHVKVFTITLTYIEQPLK